MALFLSKEELYEDIHKLPHSDKQDYFFYKFRCFLSKYMNLDTEKERDFDIHVYFQSLHISKAGSNNICGGGDCSKSSRKQFIDKYKQSVENTKKQKEYLCGKYRLVISDETDSRMFIGHNQPWENASAKLLEKDGWQWIVKSCVDNEESTIPVDLDKDLVPITIRNKIYQKWKNERRRENEKTKAKLSKNNDGDEEEEEDNMLIKHDDKVLSSVIEESKIFLKKLEQELMDEDW
jgi:hypothetical protein